MPCHASRVEAQAATPHAHALKRFDGEHFDGRKLRERSGAEYLYAGSQVSITRGEERAVAEFLWAFGAGTQAITPVLKRKGRYVEHRVSWYREGNRLGLTVGHEPRVLDLEESLGVVQSERNVARCFGCHQTAGEPGVVCQACHGDSAAHRAKPGKGTIRRDRAVALCAQCHRSPDAAFASTTPELEDERSIRFAPVGFQASRCFQRSKGFTCVTCHDPHGEAPKQSVSQVCQGCHAAAAERTCPRAPNCASCHMKRSSPMAGLTFTDHRIR